jgi:EAL domain-containing protein (putative c-di-GMP-specific phosphodiesterase class I)
MLLKSNSLLRKITTQNMDTLLLPDIVSMIHKVGLTAVAGGIEEPEQVAFLATHNCDILQGNHYGKPMKKEEAINSCKRSLKTDTGALNNGHRA